MKDDNDRHLDHTLPDTAFVDTEPVEVLDADREPWGSPLSLGPATHGPAFPVEIFPAWLQDWVEALAVALQAPVDLPAMLSLAVLSLTCAKKFAVQVRPDWEEPMNLYVVVSLKSGESKTPAFTAVTRPVTRYVAEEQKRLDPQIRAAAALYDVATKRIEHLKMQAAKASETADHDRLLKAIEGEVWEQAALQVPAQLRLILDDVTAESLEVVLRQQGGRIAILSDEGGPFELMAGRYSDGVPNIDIYLKGHSGSPISTDRIGRVGGTVRNPAITIGLAIQPDVIDGLQEKRGFRGRGLLARFLWAIPKSLVGSREADSPVVPEPVRAAYDDALTDLLRIPIEKDETGEIKPCLIDLHRKAYALLVEFKNRIEPALGPSGEFETIADWGNKLGGAAVRLAGLLHLADRAGQRHVADPGPIGEGEMRRALHLADYLLAHARVAFDTMSADPIARDAKYILTWIKRTGVKAFTAHELYQAARARFKAPAEMDAPLGLLADHQIIRQRPAPPRSGRGRPPSNMFEVNPAIHTQNSRNSEPSGPDEDFVNFVNGPGQPEVQSPAVIDSDGASQEGTDHV